MSFRFIRRGIDGCLILPGRFGEFGKVNLVDNLQTVRTVLYGHGRFFLFCRFCLRPAFCRNLGLDRFLNRFRPCRRHLRRLLNRLRCRYSLLLLLLHRLSGRLLRSRSLRSEVVALDDYFLNRFVILLHILVLLFRAEFNYFLKFDGYLLGILLEFLLISELCFEVAQILVRNLCVRIHLDLHTLA